jgi:hypothetical protein
VYHDAVAKIANAGTGIPHMTSKWKEATGAARQASRAALEELKQHKKEHGC